MFNSKIRLEAMLDKVKMLVLASSLDPGEEVFNELALFTRVASEEKSRRAQLPTNYTLEELLSAVDASQKSSTSIASPTIYHARKKASQTTKKKKKRSLTDAKSSVVTLSLESASICLHACPRDLFCHACHLPFCWQCAGYRVLPSQDPVYPCTGAILKLQWFCGCCLVAKSISAELVTAQVEECAKMIALFSEKLCCWRWIPGLCDGYSIFSVVWTALEGIRFTDSVFYCQIGTERDTDESRSDPFFLSFVQECSSFALTNLLQQEIKDERRMRRWTSIRDSPQIPPRLPMEELDLAWGAVIASLSKEMSTRIVLWKFVGTKLERANQFGYKESTRTIDVLEWNCDVEPHFDLLLKQEISLE